MTNPLSISSPRLREQVESDNRELAEILDQHERLRLVLDAARLGIWDWNPQTDEVTFNDRWAEMLGYSLDEIDQNLESWSSRVHPDDLEGCFQDIQAHIDGHTLFYENTHRMRHRDGSWRYILDRGRIMERDLEGRPIRFTGTHSDITAQKEAELRAVEAATRQKRFLAAMSHEVRTPLNGIVGILDILQTYELQPEVQEWFYLMSQSAGLLQTVVDGILDLDKLGSDQFRLDEQPFPLRESLDQAVRLFEARADRNRTRLSFSAPALPTRVIGDRHRLQQIVMNLVGNAVKFTEQGVVDVSACVDGGTLRLQVADTGIGIEDTQVIWETFRQGSVSISQKYGGTGLGLPIVKRLVDLMGGEIQLSSVMGEGSTFTVRIPLVIDAQEEQTAQTRPTSCPMMQGIHVLIAEDNPVNSRVVKAMLDHWGCASSFVKNGLEAVEAASKTSFDLILMDVHMPMMDGVSAAAALRALGNETPIIALTADSLAENRARCESAGMTGFLSKPIRRELLRAQLESIFSASTAAHVE